MAKHCMKRRESRREELVEFYAPKRAELNKIMKDPSADLDDKFAASEALQKLPKDSAKCRKRNRCWMTGRPRGVYSAVGICRNMFRILAMQGDIPGIKKASW